MTDPAPDHKPAAPGERRLVAMTPYAIAIALFAAPASGTNTSRHRAARPTVMVPDAGSSVPVSS